MNTIIEVSSANADVSSETSLTTVLSPPINLTAPTTLNFSEGFIDLRKIGNSGSDTFIINSDFDATIQMAYYELFNGQIDDKANANNTRTSAFTGTAIPKTLTTDNALNFYLGGLYAMYVVTYQDGKEPPEVSLDFNNFPAESIALITENFNFTVKAGTYSTTSIIQYINDAFQNTYYGGDDGLDFYETGLNLPIGSENNKFYLPFSYFRSKYTRYDNTKNGFKSAVVMLRLNDNPSIPNFLSDRFAYFYPQGPGQEPTVMFGTPIASLQNTDDLISFAYLHNPLYKIDTVSGDRDEFISLNYVNALDQGIDWHWSYARGGVSLVSLEPSSFWEDLLGFDFQKITLNRDRGKVLFGNTSIDNINVTGPNSIKSSTTRPYIGVSDIDNYIQSALVDNTILSNTAFENYATATPPQPLEITNTVSINAVTPIQFAQFNGGGHYRIEIDIGYYINNFNSAKTKKSIACLASREYLTNGFLSVFSGGQPIELPAGSVLSYITINILDPTTGKGATDIGSNNYFYFSLTS